MHKESNNRNRRWIAQSLLILLILLVALASVTLFVTTQPILTAANNTATAAAFGATQTGYAVYATSFSGTLQAQGIVVINADQQRATEIIAGATQTVEVYQTATQIALVGTPTRCALVEQMVTLPDVEAALLDDLRSDGFTTVRAESAVQGQFEDETTLACGAWQGVNFTFEVDVESLDDVDTLAALLILAVDEVLSIDDLPTYPDLLTITYVAESERAQLEARFGQIASARRREIEGADLIESLGGLR